MTTVLIIILSVAILFMAISIIVKNNQIERNQEQLKILQDANIKIGLEITDVKNVNFLLDRKLKDANATIQETQSLNEKQYKQIVEERNKQEELSKKHDEYLITVKDLIAENQILKDRQTKYENQLNILTEENKNLKSESSKKTIEPEPNVLKSDPIHEKKVFKKKKV